MKWSVCMVGATLALALGATPALADGKALKAARSNVAELLLVERAHARGDTTTTYHDTLAELIRKDLRSAEKSAAKTDPELAAVLRQALAARPGDTAALQRAFERLRAMERAEQRR
jgi:hypothetical protein